MKKAVTTNTRSKKQSLKPKGQSKQNTANRTSQILDPREKKRNYTAIHMAIFVSYIIRNNCKFQFVSDPKNQAQNSINMINDIYQQKNSDTNIVIILK